MALSIPNLIADEQPITGAPHAQNYAAIESHINTEMIARDGSVAMEADLMLSDGRIAVGAPLTNADMGNNVVGQAQMGDASVGTAELINGAVTNLKTATPEAGSLAGGQIQYAKSANMVHVWATPFWTSSTTATLPAGFRPGAAVGTCGVEVGSNLPNTVTVFTDGVIQAASTANLTFSVSFTWAT